ncbi:MAG TPA: aquaporin [bacterium]|nr:aquaporin [bacterium]
MLKTFRGHWPEYLMEAFGLGLFMVSACLFAGILESTGSPVRTIVQDPFLRRTLMGSAMGLTAILNIYSPWGQQSGAHLNPAVTLTFLRLGKIKFWDAVFYCLFQFGGAVAGVGAASIILGMIISEPEVNYVATLPGAGGIPAAFWAELVISFGLMTMILIVTNNRALSGLTGIFAGMLLAIYITLEAPFSGMSMNPARTVGSAFWSRMWDGWWVYFTAPVIGMLFAAEVYVHWRGLGHVFCAKLNHHTHLRCIFRCRYKEMFKNVES